MREVRPSKKVLPLFIMLFIYRLQESLARLLRDTAEKDKVPAIGTNMEAKAFFCSCLLNLLVGWTAPRAYEHACHNLISEFAHSACGVLLLLNYEKLL